MSRVCHEHKHEKFLTGFVQIPRLAIDSSKGLNLHSRIRGVSISVLSGL